ncbi:MAG: ATP-dependent Clp protease ATP-binding subunit [Myxococcales bacterium]|nr:MAG: ATP-dependent Clp protease ATP-binding subunit [Myxococcales bacterium]
MTTVSGGVKGLIARAQREAQRRGHSPSTAYLLLVMLQSGGPMGNLLSRLGVKEGDLLSAIRVVDSEPISALERAVERAYRIAKAMDAPEVLPAHLLFSIARDTRSAAHRSLEEIGAGPKRVQEALREALHPGPAEAAPSTSTHIRPTASFSPTPAAKPGRPSARRPAEPAPLIELRVEQPSEERSDEEEALIEAPLQGPPEPEEDLIVPSSSPFSLDARMYPTLAKLGRNLTELASLGRIDEVIGRDAEIERLLDVLARRRSNNPILVGPPGVGKTAIVEGLARRLAHGGEGVRGLEGTIVIELSAGGLVSGTGVRGALSERMRRLQFEVKRADGKIVLFIDEVHALFTGGDSPDDLAHELKASLARGELPCIGATTDVEYRKYVERDAALARRFSPIHVAEPTPEDAIEILRGIAPRYEVHHGIAYDPSAVESSVELSVRYIPDQTLPDKAIGLLDLAGARIRRRGGAVVDREAIAQVVAEKVRVPVERLLATDAQKLLELERHLAEHVVGHEDVMSRVSDALRKGAAGFHGHRPLATFLFLGPTGVGKTETARALNELFFMGCPMTRIDMSELSESHAVAKLVGAPPGYIGHDTGGQLTEAIRHRPYQLVLLDEIEKAHMDVLQSLLPLLEDGRLTDGKGRTVDCTHTIVVMTSNLGAQHSARSQSSIGFRAESEGSGDGMSAALGAARRALPPELWNRIDEPLFFGALSRDEVAEIARRMSVGVAKQLRERQGVELTVDATAIDALVALGGYDPDLGARPMRRVIGRMVEAPLAAAILAGEFERGDRILALGDSEGVRFETADGSVEAAE